MQFQRYLTSTLHSDTKCPRHVFEPPYTLSACNRTAKSAQHSCRFTSERRGLSSHPAPIRFVQHLLCLRFVSRLSSATDSDKLTKAHEAKKMEARSISSFKIRSSTNRSDLTSQKPTEEPEMQHLTLSLGSGTLQVLPCAAWQPN